MRYAMLARYSMLSPCVRLYGVDVAYRRLSDWTRLQLALHSSQTQRASPFSAVSGGDAALPK